jgi:hypothetical protein
MGMTANNLDRKRKVKGHGVKGRQHETKLEAFEDPTIVAYVRWQNLSQL